MMNRISVFAAGGILSVFALGCAHDKPDSSAPMNGSGGMQQTNGTSTMNPTIGAKEPGDPGDHYHPMTDDTNKYHPANSGPMTAPQQ